VCLAPSTPTDVPFISSLELRALDTTSMNTDVQNAYMYYSKRETLGTSLKETIIRYMSQALLFNHHVLLNYHQLDLDMILSCT
jgi:hypothetical protein